MYERILQISIANPMCMLLSGWWKSHPATIHTCLIIFGPKYSHFLDFLLICDAFFVLTSVIFHDLRRQHHFLCLQNYAKKSSQFALEKWSTFEIYRWQETFEFILFFVEQNNLHFVFQNDIFYFFSDFLINFWSRSGPNSGAREARIIEGLQK